MFLSMGRARNGTEEDQRDFLSESTQFRVGALDVYTNHEKQQVVLVEKVGGDQIDGTYQQDSQINVAQQVYRSVMKPNKWGVLEIRERVDNRSEDGDLLHSWQRQVETDRESGAFSIAMGP